MNSGRIILYEYLKMQDASSCKFYAMKAQRRIQETDRIFTIPTLIVELAQYAGSSQSIERPFGDKLIVNPKPRIIPEVAITKEIQTN